LLTSDWTEIVPGNSADSRQDGVENQGMDIPHYLEIAGHLGAAWLAGSLIGVERSFHGRPAGFRTHALVCLASALLMLITVYQQDWLPLPVTDKMFLEDPKKWLDTFVKPVWEG